MSDSLLARRFHSDGNLPAAEQLYLRALASTPNDVALRYDYAVLLMQSGRLEQAVSTFQAVLREKPGDLNATLALATCLRDDGRIREGLEVANAAVLLVPHAPLAWMLKGSMEVQTGHLQLAEESLRRCLSMANGFGEAWHYLGETFHRQQRWSEAIRAYQMAAVEQPGELFNIAMCAEHAGDLVLARDSYLRMSQLYPGRSDVMLRLAQVEARLCLFPEELDTTDRLSRLLQNHDHHDGAIEAFPLTFLPLDTSLKKIALQKSSQHVQMRASHLRPIFDSTTYSQYSSSRLRIGYISSDFGAHAVGRLVSEMLHQHDRTRFEVFAYSLRKHNDPIASRIRAGCEHFEDCHELGTVDIAHLIRQHNLDVLIDLNGPTDGSKPEVLALKPAPIQIGWLGFIHAQEAPWLDAILLDEHVQPANEAWPYSDSVIRLPGTLFPGAPNRQGHRDRERFGLPKEGEMVFASFNNTYKLDGALLTAWLDILKQASDARLMIYLPEAARAGFMQQWERLGGVSSRLIVVEALPAEMQADRAASCDLMLDSFRYQGGATTLDAVASGLPVLTRFGNTVPSRLGLSINRVLGMEELIASDTKDYIDIAVRLAGDPGELAKIRSRLSSAAHHCGLFDPRRSAAAIEQVCTDILRQSNGRLERSAMHWSAG
ncbi:MULTISPECIES: tetratricopeptide repeat protein [unclassified Pseudoxanthomonas]|uniref:O-linked N-acetylglucosamine transferase, SPINDLY family protein n=1 Tax=unclassified Pseudoxanthomonas TaxID=2645906 RepID=UPI0030773285